MTTPDGDKNSMPQFSQNARKGLANLAQAVVFLASVGVLGLSGCQSNPLARERLQDRQKSLSRTLDMMVRNEREAPDRMRYTLGRATYDIKEDEKQFSAGVDRLGRYMREEGDDWERLRREAPEKLRFFFGGHPDEIENRAIQLFY